MYLLYSALLAAALVVTLPYWLVQMSRHGKYRSGLKERFGQVPEHLHCSDIKPTIWVHAVSVGEVKAIIELVSRLRLRLPQHRVVVSTTTDTGQKFARKQFGDENVFYFPLDFAFAIRPYLRVLRPQLMVLAETELWPNFLRLVKAEGSQVAVVNARISDQSWPRYRRFRGLLKKTLSAVDVFLTQSEEDSRRLKELGASPDRVAVTGNLKFDVQAPALPPIVSSLKNTFSESGAGPIFVCGSTVEDEEPLLLRAFENILASHPKAVMILAPRHPERFESVAKLLADLGIKFWKRSLWAGTRIADGVLLIDTIGELSALYSLADVAFVGGSLVPRGGHNIIEPAQYGVPIVVGNHTENFRDIVQLFRSRDAVRIVGPAELPLVFLELVGNEDARIALGRRAAETLQSQTGATQRTVEALVRLIETGEVRHRNLAASQPTT